MFKSSENLRLAAEMRALERVAAPWRESRTTWFDGTPDSIMGRIAATDRVLHVAQTGYTAAHLALEGEAKTARRELIEARNRLFNDFLDDGARKTAGWQEDWEGLKSQGIPGMPGSFGDPGDGGWSSPGLTGGPDDHVDHEVSRYEDEGMDRSRDWGHLGGRTAAIDFVAGQNSTDRQELLFRAHRHASDRTGQLPVPTAQRVVQAFVAAVSREIPRPRSTPRTAAAPAAVADFDDALLFDN